MLDGLGERVASYRRFDLGVYCAEYHFGLILNSTTFKLKGTIMRTIVASIVLSIFVLSPALANPGGIPDGGVGQGNGNGNHVHGAPGPVAGAGLPFAIVGYGVYWLVRRRRKGT